MYNFIFSIHIQSFGSQVWDASLSIQVLLAGNLNDELGPVLKKTHKFSIIKPLIFSFYIIGLLEYASVVINDILDF